ncbi:MAG: lytic transglycosylase domain-containing protein [Thermocrinis sp.]|uniref:lytic transglycosylase domain-containing protein n=1 Tax=Thermocrinis sp. TaxID=2024383 RepID=UPI003BFFE76B
MRLLLLLVPAIAYCFCFEDAGRYYGVSPHLLWAIAKVESNFNPRAINRNKNGTDDIGLMQINSSWFVYLKKHGIEPSLLWEPCYNTYVGAMILRHCIDTYGYGWRAVDCYNKGKKARETSMYVWKVYKSLLQAQVYANNRQSP